MRPLITLLLMSWLPAVSVVASASQPDDLPEPPAPASPSQEVPSPQRLEFGLGWSFGVAGPLNTASIVELGLANLELRAYPIPHRDLSVDVQVNWSKTLLWGQWFDRPVLDLTTLVHWRLARRGRANLAVAPGLRTMVGAALVEGNPENLILTGTATARIGVDIDDPRGNASHGVYLRPEVGFSFATPLPTFAPQYGAVVEYTTMWKVGKGASQWKETSARRIEETRRRRRAPARQVAALDTTSLPTTLDAPLSAWAIGTGVGIGLPNSPAWPVRLAVAPLELRWFPSRKDRLSMDLQWNWSALPIGVAHRFETFHSPKLDLMAFVHMRSGPHPRTRLAVAPGVRVLHSFSRIYSQEGTETEVFVPVRLGLDHRTRDGRLEHGLYARPEVGLVFMSRGVYPVIAAMLEYTVSWRFRRRSP